MDNTSLKPKASQETLVSLLELEPTPMEATPNSAAGGEGKGDEKMSPETGPHDQNPPRQPTDLSGSGTGASTGSLGLSGGGSGHSAIYYLTRIQRYSSYALSIFTGLHFANTSLLPLLTRSVPASESYLLLAREIYQTRLSEPLLVGLPILAHVGSGVALRLLRRAHNLRRYGGASPAVLPQKHKQTPPESGSGPSSPVAPGSTSREGWRSPWPPLSWVSASGYGFAAIVGAHAFLNRGLPLAVEGDSANIGLAYVAHGFARHGAVSWLAYAGLLAFGCGHMVWGWARWLGLAARAGWTVPPGLTTGHASVDRDTRRRRRRLWLGINGLAAAATALWAAGGLGVVARAGRTEGWVGKFYDGLYERVGM